MISSVERRGTSVEGIHWGYLKPLGVGGKAIGLPDLRIPKLTGNKPEATD